MAMTLERFKHAVATTAESGRDCVEGLRKFSSEGAERVGLAVRLVTGWSAVPSQKMIHPPPAAPSPCWPNEEMRARLHYLDEPDVLCGLRRERTGDEAAAQRSLAVEDASLARATAASGAAKRTSPRGSSKAGTAGLAERSLTVTGKPPLAGSSLSAKVIMESSAAAERGLGADDTAGGFSRRTAT